MSTNMTLHSHILYSTDNGVTYKSIPHLTSVGAISQESGNIDTTDHDVAGNFATSEPGALSVGDLEFTMRYVAWEDIKTLNALLLAQTKLKLQVVMPDGNGYTGEAVLSKFGNDELPADTETQVTYSGAFKFSGPIETMDAVSA
jgi:hypothetical protein